MLIDENITSVFSYKSPMTKKGYFRKNEFVYDEYLDCYICPNNNLLKYTTTNRDGHREYKSNCTSCKSCKYLLKYTQSINHQKVVTRHK